MFSPFFSPHSLHPFTYFLSPLNFTLSPPPPPRPDTIYTTVPFYKIQRWRKNLFVHSPPPLTPNFCYSVFSSHTISEKAPHSFLTPRPRSPILYIYVQHSLIGKFLHERFHTSTVFAFCLFYVPPAPIYFLTQTHPSFLFISPSSLLSLCVSLLLSHSFFFFFFFFFHTLYKHHFDFRVPYILGGFFHP